MILCDGTSMSIFKYFDIKSKYKWPNISSAITQHMGLLFISIIQKYRVETFPKSYHSHILIKTITFVMIFPIIRRLDQQPR